MRTIWSRCIVFFHSPDTWVFLLFSLVTFLSVFGPLLYLFFTAPNGTTYRFADGFTDDYYQYLSKIKDGMMGVPYYFNRYTDIVQPPTFGHAFFPMIGLLGALLGMQRPDIVYLAARIVALLLLFVTYIAVVRTYLSSFTHRIVAYIFFFTSTSLYSLSQTERGLRAIEPIVFSSYYNALQKFSGPPQHLIAAALLLSVVLFFTTNTFPWRKYVGLSICAVIIGMLHPIVALAGVLSILFMWGVVFLFNKQDAQRLVVPVCVFSIMSALPIGYYAYLFSHIPPWTTWNTLIFQYNYQVNFFGFLRANGFFLPFLVFFVLVFRKHPRVAAFLISWGVIVPVVLFPFAYEGKGITLPRLLQIQQYIPLSILSAMGVSLFLARFKKTWQTISITLLCASAVCFAAVPWKMTIEDSFFWKQYTYFNVFIPNDVLSAFEYLDSGTPKESVVFGGDLISSMIPAFTHNRVVIGRGDVVDDYPERIQGMQDFFQLHLPPDAMKRYIDRYHVTYILFGIDGPNFTAPFTDFSYLRSVFRSGNIDVVQVIR